MAAGTYNLIIDQGGDFELGLALTEDGSAVDLTGFSGRSQMRVKPSSASITGTFVVSIVNAAEGTMSMTMSNSVTAALTPGKYFWDLEIFTASDAVVTKLLTGIVTVKAEVTK